MAKKTKKADAAIQLPERKVLIKWNVPDTMISRFASNMTVQVVEEYFKLSFFELKPEINLVPPKIPATEMNAECVATVIIPPHKIPGIISVLERQLKLYQERLNLISASIEPEQPS